jgi:ferrous-iron efflux pump FieF
MLGSILDKRFTDTQVLRLASMGALCVALILVVLKLGAYLGTGSTSLLSSLLDSASDVVASLGTFLAVRWSLKPADHDHRFGHGKAEAIAALGTAAFVCGSAAFLFFEAMSRLVTHELPRPGYSGLVVMLVSIVLTAALLWFQRYAVKRTKSQAIAADSMHYRADFLVNGAVILSLALAAYTGFALIDVCFGILIAGYLVFAILPVAREAVDTLMDKELPEAERSRILDLAKAHQDVISVHDLRTRQSAGEVFVEIHLEMDENLTIARAHAIGEEVERAIGQAFPRADVLVHFDPHGVYEKRRDDEISPHNPLKPLDN